MLKRIVSAVVLIGLVFPLMFSRASAAVTAEELIKRNIEARGGMDSLQAIKTMKVTGIGLMQGIESPGILYFKRPDKIRIEYTIQGKTLVQAYDGTTAWMIMPFMGSTDPEKMTADDAKDVKQMADFDGPLVDYKKKGNKIEYIGAEDMEGSPTYKLKITRKNGDVSYLYLDAEYYLPLKTTTKRKTQGAEIEVESFTSDYKPVHGVMMAYSVENKVKGQTVMHYTIDSVAVNIDIPDSLFAMPAVKEKKSADSTGMAMPGHKPDSIKTGKP